MIAAAAMDRLPDCSLRVGRLVTTEDERAYTRFIDARKDATFYHSLRYRDLLLAVLEVSADYLMAWDSDEVVGVLPVMIKAGPFGAVLNSLPFFGSHGAVLAQDDRAAAALWQAFRARAAAADVVSATVIQNPFAAERLFAHGLAGALPDVRISQVTQLDGETGSEWPSDAIEGSARRNARKAQAAGVKVTRDDRAIGFLADIHRQNMNEIGGTAKPAAFFHHFPQILRAGDDYRIYVAEHAGAPVAALLLFYYGQFAEYIMPVTVPGQRVLQPTAAILAYAMREAAREGRRTWNWGGTWLSQSGVYRFKRKWGAGQKEYRYATRVNEPSLLDRSAAELSAAYPYFYVAPFSALRGAPAQTASY